MNLSAFKDRLAARLPQIVLILCLIQPFLDVLSYWLDYAGLSNVPTLLLRFALLGFMLLLGFLLSERKRYYFIAAGILLVYTACHIFICLKNGYEDPIGDLTNLIRIYQLPLITLSFITYLRRNQTALRSIRLGFTVCLGIILLIELLSYLTGTNPYTYPNKSIGLLGWFYFANAQSAILSMIVPVAIALLLEKFRFHPLWSFLCSFAAFAMLYLFATRLAYAALMGTAAAFFIALLILKKLQKLPSGRAALALLLCAILAVGLFSFSPMEKNSEMVAANKILKQADIDALVEADTAAAKEEGLTGDALRLASLRSAYEKYLAGPTGRYGLERTAAVYNDSTDAGIIADERLQKLNYCRMLLEDQPISRLFGLELADMSFDGEIYDVENDFHGIYYLCGAAGLALLLVFFAWFLWRIIAALFRNFKAHFTLETVGYGIALICGLAHAYFTAGVLRRPNSTFYLAVILAAIYALTRKDRKTATERGPL